MASKYQQKKQKQELRFSHHSVAGSPSSQPFQRGHCFSGANVRQHKKATKKLQARIKDFGTIDWKRHKSTDAMHCPGSMQFR